MTSNSGLSNNHINALHADRENRVWVATDSGASVYTQGIWGAWTKELSWSMSYIVTHPGEYKDEIDTIVVTYYHVTSVTQSSDGAMWFALKGAGIARYNANAQSSSPWRRFTKDDYGLESDSVMSVAAGRLTRDVWISTRDGVARFTPTANDQGVWKQYIREDGTFPEEAIHSVAVSPIDNKTWFGVGDYGLVSFDGSEKWAKSPTPYNASGSPINSITFDALGSVWAGQWEGASLIEASTGFGERHYTHNTTGGYMPQGGVNAVLTNYSTTRWFGSDEGLVCLADTIWRTFDRQNTGQLPCNIVTALAYDLNGNLWIGTSNGLAVYSEDGVKL